MVRNGDWPEYLTHLWFNSYSRSRKERELHRWSMVMFKDELNYALEIFG